MDQKSGIQTVNQSSNSFTAKTKPVFQYDHGIKLRLFNGPAYAVWQVHFSNEDMTEAINVIASIKDGVCDVNIPDSLLLLDKNIVAFVYEEAEDKGIVVKRIEIPVIGRSRPDEVFFDSEDASKVDELVSNIGELVSRGDRMLSLTDRFLRMSAMAEVSTTGVPFVEIQEFSDHPVMVFHMVSGKDGVSPVIADIKKEGRVTTITFADANGEHQVHIQDGEKGTIDDSEILFDCGNAPV